MKKVILAALAVVSLAACGKETVREVLVTTPPTTQPSAPEVNKFDQYLIDLRNESAQARTMTDSDLLKFGQVICDAFDAGRTLNDVVTVMSQYSTNGSYDTDLYAMIIVSAVKNICPEWATYVTAASS